MTLSQIYKESREQRKRILRRLVHLRAVNPKLARNRRQVWLKTFSSLRSCR